ncbi:MAG: hypothetical protein B7C24_07560 [Bacteroidetes bacterium 4572_77]|nr:MAG: hypothetical protein B7C24_07560 [Bacteroidetes bacterium 4572_77]
MDIFELKFSNMELIGFSFMAIVILFALLGLRKFIPMLIKNPDKEKDFRRYFTMVEIMIWIVFTVFVIQQMSDSNQIYAFGLFLLLMMAGFWTLWFYFKNYISGSIFKLNDKFDINDMVKINDYQGKIVGLGNHRLELESDNGEIIYLPYSMLSDAVIVKLHPGEMVLNHSFTLSTPHDKRSKDKKEEIRFAILSLINTSSFACLRKEIIFDQNLFEYQQLPSLFYIERF